MNTDDDDPPPPHTQVQEVLEAMQADSGVELQMLKVDGGMTENDLLMQFQVWMDGWVDGVVVIIR